MNLYGYVGNDPLNATDPNGMYGRGSGWTDKDWKKFDTQQKQVAKDMRKTSSNLRDRSRSTRMPRERAQQKEMADSLDKGAATLENDGSDGKTLANLVSADFMKNVGSTPDAAANTPRGSTVINVNKDHWSWKEDDSKFMRWTYGHESLHAGAKLRDEKWGPTGKVAYRFGTEGEQDAYRSMTGTDQAARNPDHIMSEVYP